MSVPEHSKALELIFSSSSEKTRSAIGNRLISLQTELSLRKAGRFYSIAPVIPRHFPTGELCAQRRLMCSSRNIYLSQPCSGAGSSMRTLTTAVSLSLGQEEVSALPLSAYSGDNTWGCGHSTSCPYYALCISNKITTPKY